MSKTYLVVFGEDKKDVDEILFACATREKAELIIETLTNKETIEKLKAIELRIKSTYNEIMSRCPEYDPSEEADGDDDQQDPFSY